MTEERLNHIRNIRDWWDRVALLGGTDKAGPFPTPGQPLSPLGVEDMMADFINKMHL